MRFIHAADIHLDSPLINLDRYPGAPAEEFRNATRRAVDNLVELAISERVSFVLIAGDLYDGECKDINTPLELRRSLCELQREGIRVFIVQGNHDAASRVTKAFRLELPDNVHLFPTKAASKVVLQDLKVAVHGQGFASRAIEEDLSAGYPKRVDGLLNIGLLHSNCGGRAGYDDYAPSQVQGLRGHGYDYWALGHVHKREVLHRDDPWIVYSGNTQGRNVREEGEKGCTLVHVQDGRVVEVEHRAVDVVRWARLRVDASGCADAPAVVAEAGRALAAEVDKIGDRKLAARLEVFGDSAAHDELVTHSGHWDQQLREMAVDRFDDRVWLEKIKLQTGTQLDLTAIETRDDPLGELLRKIRDQRSAADAISDVRGEIDNLLQTLPSDPRVAGGAFDPDEPEQVAELLEEVKQLLVPRLMRAGEGD